MGMQESFELRKYYNQMEADAKQAMYEASMKDVPRYELRAWDVGADRAVAYQQKRTADAVGMIGMGVIALPGLAVATAPLAPALSTQALVTVGATTGGGFDYAGQYVDTKGFTTGQWRPAQTAFASITGGLIAPYAASYGILPNLGFGGLGGGVNAGLTNWYYSNDKTYERKNVWFEAGKGVLGSVAGFYTGNFIAKTLTTPINRNVSILFQNYNNSAPMLWGNSAGGAVSGVVPIGVDSSLKLFGQDKEK